MLAQLLSSIARRRPVPSKGWKVLTSKEFPKINKGKRSMKSGFLDSRGRFNVVRTMLPLYRVPDLTSFNLKPYVAFEAKEDS